MPGCPPYTKGFVCSKCGFVAFFVGTHMGDYYGVQMAKERDCPLLECEKKKGVRR